MTVETLVDRARTRAASEREAVAAKREAIDSFLDRVGDLSPERTPSTAPEVTATAGTASRGATELASRGATELASRGATGSEDRCRAVRRAFAETVRPHSVADVDGSESLLETIQSEFTDSIALALAPTTDTAFTEELQGLILTEAAGRRDEAAALADALDGEIDRLETAAEAIADVTDWIARADETPLSDLGFERLRARHETLADHRDRCDDVAARRQAFLDASTARKGGAGIRHRDLASYLYEDFPVTHPVLATAVRLDAACAECQRAVRAHLVRRA